MFEFEEFVPEKRHIPEQKKAHQVGQALQGVELRRRIFLRFYNKLIRNYSPNA